MKPPRRKKGAAASRAKTGPVRYAVVGLGHIAQVAVLPAFANVKNSRLVALVSGDPVKRAKLGKKYQVPLTYGYEQYDECLRSGEIDAVFIALPNERHREYCVRAARAGIHVLCEKPLALTMREGVQIVRAAEKNRVKFMTAYRLHFDPANLSTIALVRSGRLGEPRYFNSTFSFQLADPGNIRTKRAQGGGAINDIGVYCINAARYLFASEPTEVFAVAVNSGDPRFREVDETTSVIMRFPRERVASFTVSFGASRSGRYQLVGTKGSVTMDPAYEYAQELRQIVTIDGRSRETTFPHTDQFGGEIETFSECILQNREPEASGWEGVADLRVLDAIHESARTHRRVKLPPFKKKSRPDPAQVKRKPAIAAPKLVNVVAGS
jgi:predicted dehydrogenase